MADTFYQYLSLVARDFIFFSGDVQTTTIAVAIASSLCCSIVWAICHVVTVVQNSHGYNNKRKSITNTSWTFTSTSFEKIAGRQTTKNDDTENLLDADTNDLYNQQVEVPCVRCSDYFADAKCRFVTCKLCCFSRSACFFHQNNKHVQRRRCKHPPVITQIDLSKSHINQCPDRIGFVGAQLTHLNLSNNNLSELPSEIGCLRGLQELLVFDNHLQDLPESLGTLLNLRILKLGNNKIQILPEFLTYLSNLEQLDISQNLLSSLPSNIGELRNLQLLYTGNNKLEEIPLSLYKLQNLKVLDVCSNPLRYIQDDIQQLLRLEELNITACDLDEFPVGLCHCSSLVTLHASYNRFKKLPVLIGLLSKLEEIYLMHNKLKYLPANLNMNRLRMFNVSDNPFLTTSDCDKYQVESLTVILDKNKFPSLLELCARCITSKKSALCDTDSLPQSLKDLLQNKRTCTRCGGPFFKFYESRIDFVQHQEGNIPFYTEICTPHRPYCI